MTLLSLCRSDSTKINKNNAANPYVMTRGPRQTAEWGNLP